MLFFFNKTLCPAGVTGQDHTVVKVGDLWKCLTQGIYHIPYAKVYVYQVYVTGLDKKLRNRVNLTERHTDRQTKLKQYALIVRSGA